VDEPVTPLILKGDWCKMSAWSEAIPDLNQRNHCPNLYVLHPDIVALCKLLGARNNTSVM